ncbi:class I SAM-dependent DNA methyltransferase [Streptomyces sp. NPDC059009]|uniref:class I SAM-dependent DNA methyltransferase n=1 Tax=Streptomyces sp. NPDC059009 TaxID=3346694 RepID=UPI003681ABD2
MTEAAYIQTARAAYDVMAAHYNDHFNFRAEPVASPYDRAVLATYAELLDGAGAGARVADVGCGTGRVTAHLDGLGVDVFGVDLSPGMLAEARRDHPGLRFDEGSMTSLGLADGSLAGIVAWYSLIHIAPAEVPDVLAGFARVLAPGGLLLLAFQVGDESLHLTEAFGHEIGIDFHRMRPERLEGQLAEAGFTVDSRLVRAPAGPMERTEQAYMIARKGGPLGPLA